MPTLYLPIYLLPILFNSLWYLSPLSWLHNYNIIFFLPNRSHVVKLNNFFSAVRGLLCGVPQWTVLEPHLFTTHTTEFPITYIKFSSVHIYAKDTQHFSCMNQARVKLKEDNSYHNLIINDEQLTVSEKSNNFGPILYVSLRFSEHISHCIQRSYNALKLLYHHQNYLNLK